MKRPLFYFVCFFIFGIIIARYFFEPYQFLMFFVVTLLITIIFYSRSLWKGCFLAFLFFIFGYFLSINKLNINDNFVENIINKNEKCIIEGIVIDISYTDKNRPKVNFKIKSITHNNIKKIFNHNGIIYLPIDESIKINEKLILYGNFSKLQLQKNIGGYNEKISYLSNNFKYKVFAEIQNREGIVKGLNYYLKSLRNNFINVYDRILPEKEAGIIKTMILGYSNDLDENIRDLYIKNGIYHILAISGTHITLISIFVLYILRKLFSLKTSYLLTLFFLILYCAFTGGRPSVVRSVLMISVFFTGKILYYESDLLTSLSFSAFFVLIYNPATFWNLSFQLSYSSVLSICIFYDPIERFLNLLIIRLSSFKLLKFLAPISFIFSISVLTIPLNLFYFFSFNTYFVFSNLVILPTISLLIIISFITGLVGLISFPISFFLSGVIYFILKSYEIFCNLIVLLPFSSILIGRPKFIFYIFYFTVVYFFYKLFVIKGNSFKTNLKFFNISLLTFVMYIFINKYFFNSFVFTMLDVGQGDCFIFSNNLNTFIFDTSSNYITLKNYLDFKGIKKIDALFISHMDLDHSGGAINLLKDKKVKKVFFPEMNLIKNDIYLEVYNYSKIDNIDILFLKNNDILSFGKDLVINVLNPIIKNNFSNDNNDNSLVLKLNYKKFSFLLTGDISKETEKNILENNVNISADVLKVSHHGSKSGSSIEFIKKVSPKVSLISVGLNNKYGHPNDEVILNLQNSKILRTDYNGEIDIFLKNNKMVLKKKLEE